MDELTRRWFEMTCRQRLREAHAQAFQDLFSELMELAYPGDFRRIRPYGSDGDLKCDGYLASRRLVFQVYAPRTLKKAELIRKIRQDFIGAAEHWQDRMAAWVLVHNDHFGLPAEAVQVIADLAAAAQGVVMEVWGPADILMTSMRLPADALTLIFGPAPTERSFRELRSERLADILRSLKRQLPPPQSEIRPVSSEKLAANAFSEDVPYFLSWGRRKEPLVAKLLADWPTPGFAEELAEGFRQRYAELKAQPGITADETFQALQEYTTGSQPLSDPSHQAAVLAILSYFFERCDIFEDKPGDDSP
jgi:hypothetical protein